MVGFCNVEVKEFGPVHEYVAPAIALAVKLSGEPTQAGLLLETVGAGGVGAAVTVTVALTGGQPVVASPTETVYVPALLTLIEEVVCPPGDHKYVYGIAPPVTVAVSVIDPGPAEQRTPFVGATLTVIAGTTFTRIVSRLVPGHDVVGVPLTI